MTHRDNIRKAIIDTLDRMRLVHGYGNSHIANAIMNKIPNQLNIELNEFDYTGSSNDIYGMEVKVNGELMPLNNMDTATILQQVLEHLGYKVTIAQSLDN